MVGCAPAGGLGDTHSEYTPLGASHKCHTVFVILCLACFTTHNALKFNSCYSLKTEFQIGKERKEDSDSVPTPPSTRASVHPSTHAFALSLRMRSLTRASGTSCTVLLCGRPWAGDPTSRSPRLPQCMHLLSHCLLARGCVFTLQRVSQSSPSSDVVAITRLMQTFSPQRVPPPAGRLPHVPGSRVPTSMQKSKCDFRLDGLRWGNVSSQGLSTCSPVRCSIGTASLPANPVLSPAATPHTSSLGAHTSPLCSWSSGLPLPPEWSKVFELTGPHCMSPSVCWYLGPGTSGIIFVGFLLGLKVLLLMGFTVTHICRWRSL